MKILSINNFTTKHFRKLLSGLYVGVNLKSSLWSLAVKLLIDNIFDQFSGNPLLRKFGPPESLKKLNGLLLILIIIGSVQVAVQIEEEKQENEVSPVLTSDKGVSTAMESEAGKEYIEMEEIGKIENSGMYCN